MSTSDLESNQNTLTREPNHPSPTVAVQEAPHNGPSIGFFVAGLVVNIAVIAAFLIWAFKQHKNSHKRKSNS